eukprot:11916038-Ditylum_brightwellii.AAC.1
MGIKVCDTNDIVVTKKYTIYKILSQSGKDPGQEQCARHPELFLCPRPDPCTGCHITQNKEAQTNRKKKTEKNKY